MTDLMEKFDAEIEALLIQVAEVGSIFDKSSDKNPLHRGSDYQAWYTRAHATVRMTIPARAKEFEELYRNPASKNMTLASYTISDYLTGVSLTDESGACTSVAISKFVIQIGILKAARAELTSAIANSNILMHAEHVDRELDAATELIKSKTASPAMLRAAGTLAGVALESHLYQVCLRHNVPFPKNPTINDYGDALRKAGILEINRWRELQSLSDTRNICAHQKGRDPQRSEVSDLLERAAKFVKEIT